MVDEQFVCERQRRKYSGITHEFDVVYPPLDFSDINNLNQKTFEEQKVIAVDSQQEEVFNDIGIHMVDDVIEGFNRYFKTQF